MARSDLLLNLVRSGSKGDRSLFRRTVEAVIAEERAKQHNVLADRLDEALRDNGNNGQRPQLPLSGARAPEQLLHEVTPRRRLSDLVLPEDVRSVCQEVIEEQERADLLRAHQVEPRHRLLFIGSPGNGKTSLAEAMAEALVLPLLVVRYEGVIGSYLGETASRLQRVFDHVRTRECLLFFDEFDSIGKERGDTHETGEIKRVVSSLLLQIDALPSHVVVVTATNHPELLDRAVWRRFQVRVELPPPTRAQREEWFRRLEIRTGKPLGFTARTLADKTGGLSFGELEELGADITRRVILDGPAGDLRRTTAERVARWRNQRQMMRDHDGGDGR